MPRNLPRPLLIATAVALLAAGTWVGITQPWQSDEQVTLVGPTDPLVAAAEQARRAEGASVRDVELTAAPATIDLGDRRVETWAFNGTVPGPEIRVGAGDVVRARVRNELPDPLTIHWHGIALRNDMDGVPGVTQQPIEPGEDYLYEFTAPDPGTYFYHPHTGTQLDRGLYAPLIVEDAEGTDEYDRDVTLMLDDWIDGTGQTPDEVLAGLGGAGAGMDMGDDTGGTDMDGMDMGDDMSGMDMGDDMSGMDMGDDMGGMGTDMDADADDVPSPQAPLGDDTGDVAYPLYLINGRSPTTPAEIPVSPNDRVRLRLVNAGSDTPFRVAVGGSRLTVIATDGFAVEPVTVDTLLVAMGERYDVIATVPASAGAVPVVAVAEGKGARAIAVLRAGPGETPAPDAEPAELRGDLLTLDDLRAAPDVALPAAEPARTYRVTLTGDMATYRWGIDASQEAGATMPVREGERVRLVIENQTPMWHPIHLHGQTFQVGTGSEGGPRKDTVIVPAMGTVTVEFVADNPGQWLLHCHNIYHAEAGMATVLSYVT